MKTPFKYFVLLLALCSCNSQEQLITEIKASYNEILDMSIEEGMNRIAGVKGEIKWLLVNESGVTDTDKILLEVQIKTYEGNSGNEIHCTYRFLYNKSTKQNLLWYAKVNDWIAINRGQFRDKPDRIEAVDNQAIIDPEFSKQSTDEESGQEMIYTESFDTIEEGIIVEAEEN